MTKWMIGLSALALAGCAVTPEYPWPSEAAARADFVGGVRFSNGEFQLYADQDQVLQPFSRPCLSGAASRDEMRQAVQDLGGQKVTISGQLAPWSQAVRGRIEHRGSDIRNDCGGRNVLLADDIRPAS